MFITLANHVATLATITTLISVWMAMWAFRRIPGGNDEALGPVRWLLPWLMVAFFCNAAFDFWFFWFTVDPLWVALLRRLVARVIFCISIAGFCIKYLRMRLEQRLIPQHPVAAALANETIEEAGLIVASETEAIHVESSKVLDRLRRLSMLLSEPELIVRVFDALPDGVVVVDRDGKIIMVNAELEFMTGYARGELETQPLAVLIPDAQRDLHEQHRKLYMSAPRIRPMGIGKPLALRQKDGTSLLIDVTLSPAATRHGIMTIAAVRRAHG